MHDRLPLRGADGPEAEASCRCCGRGARASRKLASGRTESACSRLPSEGAVGAGWSRASSRADLAPFFEGSIARSQAPGEVLSRTLDCDHVAAMGLGYEPRRLTGRGGVEAARRG